ncbi:MAG TPA: hypothetical protein VJS38_17275 [Phenylobacterium sp.]|uniref:hypothetical protein n=1 Tax=Phenylobacterium sp. TaxID=1871053 RepID=UPI002B493ED2|nr:hypothetical protein [Phenylobacterium sp.]HKR89924.1 hypothetical protein [Phenylobacterium sp.]
MTRKLAALIVGLALAASAANAAPSPKDWAAVARLPDWSGVWAPDVVDQNAQVHGDPPPWKPEVARQVAALEAQEKAGRPKGLFVDCLPHGMPALMLVTHNPIEFVFAPGRVILLGESDGNRLRRIRTDGRPHAADPDPSFFGDAIGRWEGGALVVDTVGVLPQTYIAVSEAVGIPNDGDLHVVERIRLEGADTLVDELTITAPHVLTGPWTTRRLYHRQRDPAAEIVEGVCLQGRYLESRDADGHAAFSLLPLGEDGAPAPPK